MENGRKMVKMLEILLLVVAVVLMGSFGQIYMKKGLNSVGGLDASQIFSGRLIQVLTQWGVLFGVLLYASSAIIWLTVLSKVEVSFAYPLIALGYIVTAFLAKAYFNENVTIIRWLGILLIIGGVFLVTRS